MSTQTVAILEGSTFVVSDRRGDIEASPTDTMGLFADDTRFLSRWVFTINGVRPSVLSTDDVQYFEAKFFLAPTSGTIYVDVDMSGHAPPRGRSRVPRGDCRREPLGLPEGDRHPHRGRRRTSRTSSR